MDPTSRVLVMVSIGLVFVAITKIIVSGIIRYTELQQCRDFGPDRSIEERLERMEIAIDAIAIEVERAGELQRFTAQLSQLSQPAQQPASVPRVVTPH